MDAGAEQVVRGQRCGQMEDDGDLGDIDVEEALHQLSPGGVLMAVGVDRHDGDHRPGDEDRRGVR